MIKKPDIPPHYFIRKRALSLEKEGKNIIHLELGEPDIKTHPEIIIEMYNKALEGYTKYGSVLGIEPIRTELAEYMNNNLKVHLNKNNIILIPGSKISIFLLLYTLLKNRNKNILVLTPTWGVYLYLIKDMGYKIIQYRLLLKNNWMLTDEDLDNINEKDFDAIIIVNPSNPTGGILSKNNIKALVEIASSKKAYIFADEIYFNLVFNGYNFHSFIQENYEKAIGVYSFSKAYAMTGFRLGWLVADKDIIQNLSKKMQLIFTNIPTFIQYAGLKALKMPKIVERNRVIYMKRTYLFSDKLYQLGFKFLRPRAGFYIFPMVPDTFKDGFEFAYKLLDEEGVTVAPGIAFGEYDNYIRLCTAVSEKNIEESINRLSKFLDKHS